MLKLKNPIYLLLLCGCTPLLGTEPADPGRRALGPESSRALRTAEGRVPLAVGAVSHLLLPTSANATGRFGAIFKTKVSIFNAVNSSYDIRVGLSDSSGEIAHTFVSLSPGETLTFNNILGDLFGFTGAGAIDLDSGSTAFLFIVNSQVYVDTVAGRYTTAVQFADDLGAITPSRPGFAVGVSNDSLRRLNVGCASNTSVSQTITFQGFDRDNFAVGDPFAFTLVGFGWGQFFAANFSLTNGGVRITTTGNAVCWAVEVDNISNDGTFQLVTPF